MSVYSAQAPPASNAGYQVNGSLQVLSIKITQVLEEMQETMYKRGLTVLINNPSIPNALGLLQNILQTNFCNMEVMHRLEHELTELQFLLNNKMPLLKAAPQDALLVLQDIGTYSEALRQICLSEPNFIERINPDGSFVYQTIGSTSRQSSYKNFTRPATGRSSSLNQSASQQLTPSQVGGQTAYPTTRHSQAMASDLAASGQWNQTGLEQNAYPVTPQVTEQARPGANSSSNDHDDDVINPVERFQKGETMTYEEFLQYAQQQGLTTSAATFVFRIFSPTGVMNVYEFYRTKNFLEFTVWDHLDAPAVQYYQLFKFMDDRNKDKLTKRQFQSCFKTFFGYLQYMEQDGEELELDRQDGQDANKLTSYIDLLFNQADMDKDCFLDQNEFCIGFRAALGLLLVAKRWLNDQSGSFKDALYLLNDEQAGFLDFRHWSEGDIQTLFSFVDSDGDGFVDREEYTFFMLIFTRLNPKIEVPGFDQLQIRKLEFLLIDREDKKKLGLEQFVETMLRVSNQPAIKDHGNFHFHVFFTLLDIEEEDSIDDEMIKHFLENIYHVTADKVFVKKLDTMLLSRCRKHGAINRGRFVKYCQKVFSMDDGTPCTIM